MYQIGNQVVYGVHGICRITDMENQLINKKQVTYFVLEPMGQEGCRYLVPAGNEAAMAKLHPVLSPGEWQDLLCSDTVRNTEWIQDDNQRKQTYREIISSGDRFLIARMLHTLYRHKKILADTGKKMHMADENFLRDAEKMLLGEIAVVMNLTQDEAKDHLRNQLSRE